MQDERLIARVHQIINKYVTDPVISKKVLFALGEPGKVLALPESAIFSWSNTMLKVVSIMGEMSGVALDCAICLDFFITAADIFDDLADEDKADAAWSNLTSSEQLCLAMLLWQLSNNLLLKIEPQELRVIIQSYFAQAATCACIGQFKDVSHPQATSLEDSFTITREKSGALMALCLALGGLAAKVPVGSGIQLLWALGETYGTINQLHNDIRAVLSPEGKSDIRTRKITLPIAFCLNRPNGKPHPNLADYYIDKTAEWPAEDIAKLVVEQGGIVYTLTVLESLKKQLPVQIDQLPYDIEVKKGFAKLLACETI